MSKFANCVRFVVKEGCVDDFITGFTDSDFQPAGMLVSEMFQSDEREFVSFGVFESEDALVAARPEMIAFLDTIRDYLEEISPELGVTDPRSGNVLWSMN